MANMNQNLTNLLVVIGACSLLNACTRTSPTPDQPPQLQITSINPTAGSVNSIDTINGTGFSTAVSANSVFFNNRPATVISATTTQLIVRVPDSATTGNVSVHVNGSVANGPVFTVQSAANAPTITSFMLPIGKPGDQVTIVGTNFSNIGTTDTVKFNGVIAVVTAASPTELIATVPLGASTGKITVTVAVYYTHLTLPTSDL